MGNILDENDVKEFFRPLTQDEVQVSVELNEPKPEPESKPTPIENKNRSTFLLFSKFVILFIVIFFLSFSIINASALTTKFRYFYDITIKKTNYSISVPTPTANPFDATTEARMVIPKIGVDVPISWNVSDQDLNDKLLQGVVHTNGTALPGQQGNIFITGHSSYYSWSNSPYKSVFALLDKLSEGDKIYIKYSSKVFTYEVKGSKVVKPSETSVMDQFPGYNLSLMTCVPVGTNLNRLIVSAQEVNSQNP